MTRAALALLVLFLPAAAAAQGLDDVLAGFDDAPLPAPSVSAGSGEAAGAAAPVGAEPPAERRLTFSGVISQRLVVNTGGQAAPFDGLSSLRTQVHLNADLRLPGGWRGRVGAQLAYDAAFAANGRSNYQPGYLDAYEMQAELGEAYVQGAIGPNTDLRIGRQIVVWGKADALRVTDILNPLDMREPGLTDIRDLRLPLTMVKLDHYVGDWNLSAMAIAETRFNKMPVFGSDFYPGAAPAPADDSPGEGFGNPEFALAANGTFTGWDMSLYAASVYNDAPHGEMTGAGLRRRHARLSMLGASANVSAGNLLIKAEAAYLDGLKFLNTPGRTYRRLDLMAGLDVAGLPWGTLTLEAANRRILNYDPAIAGGPEDARRDETELALRLGGTLLRDRLDVTATMSLFGPGGSGGALQRVQAAYDVTDAAKVIFGFVNYDNGTKAQFANIADRDRLYAKFEYRF